jgi:hypothetical protein
MKRSVFFLLAALLWGVPAQARDRIEIKGDYLLYSFDYNYVFGQGAIVVKGKDFTVQAGVIDIDMARRLARLGRDCQVQAGKEKYAADIIEIDLDDLSLRLVTYKENVLSWTLATQKKAGEEKAAEARAAPRTAEVKTDAVAAAGKAPIAGITAPTPPPAKKIEIRSYESLKKSLVYFLNSRIVITANYRLYGYQSIVFVEGIQSLAFKKFKLDKGLSEYNENGFAFDRIWYYQSQGLVLSSHLLLSKAGKHGLMKSDSALDVMYDVLGTEVTGSRGKLSFKSLNTLPVSKNSGLSLNVNYLTDNMFNAALNLKTQWTPQIHSDLAAEYSLTAAGREELWLRLRSGLNNRVLGSLQVNLAYEKEKQYMLELSLQNQAIRNFTLSARHARSRLMYAENQFNSQSNSSISLSYSHKLFNLVTDYSFHQDLLLDQNQGNPQVRLTVNPFRMYGGLLQLNFSSSFVVNRLENRGVSTDLSKANMSLALQSERIELGGGQELSFSLAAEQLIDQDPENNFTSLGCIFKASQSLWDVADLNFLFNYQTRRQSGDWFIQGTTSQGWSLALKLKEKENWVQGWVSLSFDTKTGRFTSGLLDCSVAIIKNWFLQTQMNYDFTFDKFSYDLYLIRRAGRFMIRGSYRSLSKQFLVEVLTN